MKYAISIIIFTHINYFCKAQLSRSFTYDYSGYLLQLSKEANKKCPNSPYNVIDLDSLYNVFFTKKNAHIAIDTSSSWKIMFENHIFSEHNILNEVSLDLSHSYITSPPLPKDLSIEPGANATLTNTDSSKITVKKNIPTPKKNFKILCDSKVYTGKELFFGLGIDSAFLNNDFKFYFKNLGHDVDSLKDFPQIYERNDPLNGVWIPFTNGDYLILRKVDSYPDGSQTSFYREYLLYFRKE